MACALANEPFSELANEWAAAETLAHPVAFAHDPAHTRTALEAGQFQALVPQQVPTGLEPYAWLKLHRVPGDPTANT